MCPLTARETVDNPCFLWVFLPNTGKLDAAFRLLHSYPEELNSTLWKWGKFKFKILYKIYNFTFGNLKKNTLIWLILFLVFPNFHVSDLLFFLMEPMRGGDGECYHPYWIDMAQTQWVKSLTQAQISTWRLSLHKNLGGWLFAYWTLPVAFELT